MAVKQVTSFGRSGLSDWLVQRVSGVVLAVYTFWVVGYLLTHGNLEYAQWVAVHQNFAVRVLSLAAVLALAAHAWIGLWAVLTDYVTVRLIGEKATAIRMFLQLAMIAVILIYVIWAIEILWGV